MTIVHIIFGGIIMIVPILGLIWCQISYDLVSQQQRIGLFKYMRHINNVHSNISGQEIEQHLVLIEIMAYKHMVLTTPRMIDLYCDVIRKKHNLQPKS